MQLELLPSPVVQLLLAEPFPGSSQSCRDTPGVGEPWLQGKELEMSAWAGCSVLLLVKEE